MSKLLNRLRDTVSIAEIVGQSKPAKGRPASRGTWWARSEPARPDPKRPEPQRPEPPRGEPPRPERSVPEPPRPEPSRSVAPRPERPRGRLGAFLRRARMLAVVTLLGGALLWILSQATGGASAPRFEWEEVKRGDMALAVATSGTLTPLVSAKVMSPVSGTVSQVLVDFGAKVQAGQVLAKLDDASLVADLQVARLGVEKARAALDLARRNTKYAVASKEAGLISAADYDKVIGAEKQVHGDLKVAEASSRKSQMAAEQSTIRAPIDGIVLARNVEVGQSVSPDSGAAAVPLFDIAEDPNLMQIEASVVEADIGQVAVGQKVTFSVDAFPGKEFKGEVAQVRSAPRTDQNVVTYPVIVRIKNDGDLRPGMTANLSILVVNREDVLRIPNAALKFKPPKDLNERKPGLFGSLFAADTAPDAAQPDSGKPHSKKSHSGKSHSKKSQAAKADSDHADAADPAPSEAKKPDPAPADAAAPAPEAPGSPGSETLEPPKPDPESVDPNADQDTEKKDRKKKKDGGATVYRLAGGNGEASGSAGGTLEKVNVTTGLSDGRYTEILDGLQEGDRVVLSVEVPKESGLLSGIPSLLTGGGKKKKDR